VYRTPHGLALHRVVRLKTKHKKKKHTLVIEGDATQVVFGERVLQRGAESPLTDQPRATVLREVQDLLVNVPEFALRAQTVFVLVRGLVFVAKVAVEGSRGFVVCIEGPGVGEWAAITN
jgi:hypothetical protein